MQDTTKRSTRERDEAQYDGVPSDEALRALLDSARTIAVVGLSDRPARASQGVARYLVAAGYTVYGVNPRLAGETVAGAAVYATLADVPGEIDIVDVFRRLDAIPQVVDETLELADRKRIGCLWLQLGLFDGRAARRAQQAGLTVVMDRCLKIEHARLQRR